MQEIGIPVCKPEQELTVAVAAAVKAAAAVAAIMELLVVGMLTVPVAAVAAAAVAAKGVPVALAGMVADLRMRCFYLIMV